MIEMVRNRGLFTQLDPPGQPVTVPRLVFFLWVLWETEQFRKGLGPKINDLRGRNARRYSSSCSIAITAAGNSTSNSFLLQLPIETTCCLIQLIEGSKIHVVNIIAFVMLTTQKITLIFIIYLYVVFVCIGFGDQHCYFRECPPTSTGPAVVKSSTKTRWQTEEVVVKGSTKTR